MAENIENFVQNNLRKFKKKKINKINKFLDYQNLPWMNIFSYMIILELLLTLFINISHPDFVGIILLMGILIVHNTTFQKEPFKNINRFLMGLAGNILNDLIWILINLKVRRFS